MVRLPVLLVTSPNDPLVGLLLAPPRVGWFSTLNASHPEVERVMVHQTEPTQDRKIPFPEARLAEAVPRLHAEGSGSRLRECVPVEPHSRIREPRCG
jgi:hypothetical protein